MSFKRLSSLIVLVLVLVLAQAHHLLAQADQGTITGMAQDPSGAVIANATVTLTNIDLGQVLNTKTDGAGMFTFPPVKIGSYKITVGAAGFETTTQMNIHLSLQQRLSVPITLKPGATTETVTVTTEAPLMQTQESSVGQVMDTETIDSVPLNGRNWVYIAQLSAGAVPPSGSRGTSKGDFNANGQRAEENNFILDGVDNNANVVDFYNGASFVAQPPPDALAEFKVMTGDYSAEFGHSAGAVINASIKSGSNNIHGSLWEYFRNTVLDTYSWTDDLTKGVPAYHENQFGATLGFPVIKNKLFLFGDAQANRIVYNEAGTYTVPTARMREGDFGEAPYPLYYQTATAAPVAITGNCLAAGGDCLAVGANGVKANATALKVLSQYPTANKTAVYNNYTANRPVQDNTFQWDARADWTIGQHDTTYSRFSYWNQMGHNAPPLGTTLDGGGFGDDGKQKNLGQNFMWSETHVFSDTLTNEARVGYNYMHTGFAHPNSTDTSFAEKEGFGGIPVSANNGGLPYVEFDQSGLTSNTSHFGSPTWSTTDEHENVYQILDNVTKIAGNHSLKAGVSFMAIRFSTLQPQNARGNYAYTGLYTSNLGASNTGFDLADFALDLQHSAGISNVVTNGDARWDNAAYIQDDWRVNQKLTVNLGVRWEYFQPYKEVGGNQASYNLTSTPTFDATTGEGKATAQYLIPKKSKAKALAIMDSAAYSPNYSTVLAEDGVSVVFTDNDHLINAQKNNFAPRVGFAYSINDKLAVRGGYGIFFGGLESTGYWPNLGENYPFQYTGTISAGSCTAYYCPTDGITIANGFSSIIANGFASNTTNLTMRGADFNPKTPYTQDWNLSFERSITNDMVATLSYVGNTSRHLQVFPDPNGAQAYQHNGNNVNSTRALPHTGGTSYTNYAGMSDYSSLQTKLEKRSSHGYNFLVTYTWSHSLDDAPTPLGSTGDGGFRASRIIPIKMDYSNTPFDTRQRLTFNGQYDLPFGKGKTYLNNNKVADIVVGGWSANATFMAQSGNPLSVYTSGISTAAGANNTFAIKSADPFVSSSCATKTRNRNHWYNPCSFTNPWDTANWTDEPDHYIPTGKDDVHYAAAKQPIYVTDLATVLKYAGGKRTQVVGPGYERVNMSIFKNFNIYKDIKFEFRSDIFNVFNTPTLGQPSTNNNSSSGGAITGTRSLQLHAPDSRFIQFSGKLSF